MIKLAIASLSVLSVSIAAQAFVVTEVAATETSTMVCMNSAGGLSGASPPLTVIVGSSRINELGALGFVQEPCGGKESSFPQNKAEICKLAAAPSSLRLGFEQSYGISPVKLCQYASEI